MVGLSIPFHYIFKSISLSWAVPLSLAATHRISIDFFSCRYLDVSIPHVRLFNLCIELKIIKYKLYWVSPFGNLRINAC